LLVYKCIAFDKTKPPQASKMLNTVAAIAWRVIKVATNRPDFSRAMAKTVTRQGNSSPEKYTAVSIWTSVSPAMPRYLANKSNPSLRTQDIIAGSATSAGSRKSHITGAISTARRSNTPVQATSEAMIVIAKKIGSEIRKNARILGDASLQTAGTVGTAKNVLPSMVRIFRGDRDWDELTSRA
jgi:hypothetical protein